MPAKPEIRFCERNCHAWIVLRDGRFTGVFDKEDTAGAVDYLVEHGYLREEDKSALVAEAEAKKVRPWVLPRIDIIIVTPL